MLSREDHIRKISSRKQRTEIGKYTFVNRTIMNWNRLPADLLASFPCKLNTFRKRVKKVVTNEWIRWGLTVNICIYCVLFAWLLYASLYFIILGTCYCMFAFYCIVLFTFNCIVFTFYCIMYVLFYVCIDCIVLFTFYCIVLLLLHNVALSFLSVLG
jgi:hypothetical protein